MGNLSFLRHGWQRGAPRSVLISAPSEPELWWLLTMLNKGCAKGATEPRGAQNMPISLCE